MYNQQHFAQLTQKYIALVHQYQDSSGRTNPGDASSSWATSSTRTASRARECSTSRRGSSDGLTPENYFGEDVAERYDESAADMFDPDVLDPAVEFLAELAGDGAALELGIGTGRIALPLAQRGVRVHGIDLSAEMVAKLHEKPGGEQIEVAIGDFATTKVDGSFSLAYIVFNTIGNLTTQDAQVACFENVAAHLGPGGCFVIEIGVPGSEDASPGRAVPGLRLQRGAHRNRRARRREPGPDLASPLAVGRQVESWCRCRSATCGRRSST